MKTQAQQPTVLAQGRKRSKSAGERQILNPSTTTTLSSPPERTAQELARRNDGDGLREEYLAVRAVHRAGTGRSVNGGGAEPGRISGASKQTSASSLFSGAGTDKNAAKTKAASTDWGYLVR